MDKILVLDFGGQYNQLIARRVREQRVFAEVRGYDKITLAEIVAAGYVGIIFTGGPNSVYEESAPHFDPAILDAGIPILGICYGCQLLAWMGGGEIRSAGNISEYGKVELLPCAPGDPLLRDVPETSVCWMSHMDYVSTPPTGFSIMARTRSCPCAAFSDPARQLYGVQFHPEVTHTEYGAQILRNFLFSVCACAGDWSMGDYCQRAIAELREKIGSGRVLLALSGGVDSSVCAALLAEAVGSQLTCVFVDHGLMRKDEGDEVERAFAKWDLDFVRVNAAKRFLTRLHGVEEPERKRKIIGEEFIRVFEEEGRKIGQVDFLAQGTIYPDVIESGLGAGAVIKSHHNVGGLPDAVEFREIVEPLRLLFKDEVRQLGRELGLPEYLVMRQPFPGPGLAIRVLGEVTEDKLAILREADAIFREEMAASGQDRCASQYFAVLTGCRSVGVMGDARTYGWTIALRSVTTDDFMTADWSRIPYETLEKASSRITNEVPTITRVVYDITSKPPATVEWE
ncbi:MAG: glutamine-hydrolyzing GMP synthase [Oscillospiraceae bacterium]|nr:glutamine-hydrolyzing GMP synthase [Oscillospiraceae bacterium]